MGFQLVAISMTLNDRNAPSYPIFDDLLIENLHYPPVGRRVWKLLSKTRGPWLSNVKIADAKSVCLHMVPACDRRTDGAANA